MNARSTISVLALCLAGCSEGTGPMPVNGYDFTRVSYEPPPLVNPTLLEIPPFDLDTPPESPALLDFPDKVTPGFPFAVEGLVNQVQETSANARIVLIEWSHVLEDVRKPTPQALTGIDPSTATDGTVHYYVEFTGPKQDFGHYNFEVRLVRPTETPDKGIILATGEFELVAE